MQVWHVFITINDIIRVGPWLGPPLLINKCVFYSSGCLYVMTMVHFLIESNQIYQLFDCFSVMKHCEVNDTLLGVLTTTKYLSIYKSPRISDCGTSVLER